MRKILLTAAVAAILSVVADTGWAACGQLCRQKCDQTYHQGGFLTPQACYDVWSTINAQHGKKAVRFEGKVGMDKKSGKVRIYR